VAAVAAINEKPRVKQAAREEGRAICRALCTWVPQSLSSIPLIVQNPVKAGLVDTAEQYPYCYTYLAKRKRRGF
jgi:hypothetical protein